MVNYYAGMDLDAPCGRCKDETRHRILSITDGTPEKMICAACGSVHKFRVERPKTTRTSSGTQSAPAGSKRSSASPGRFQELMIAEQAGTKAKPYTPAEKWEEGLWMDHPTFGLGKVQRKVGRKVEVLFREGLKTLISG